MRINRANAEATFKHSYHSEPAGLSATRTALSRLLRSMDSVGWSSREESGRLDRHALTRYAVGDANIFSRRQYQEAEKAAVEILIDCSGSMSDSILLANEFAIQLGKMLEKSKTEFCCYGFRSGETEYFYGESNNGYVDGGNGYADGVRFIPFKGFGKKMSPVLMGSIEQSTGGGTPDYTAVWHGVNLISMRPEKKRVLFVIGDSAGYNIKAMQHLEKLANKQGIVVIGIGIGYTDMPKCFTNATNIYKMEDLAGVGLRSIIKALV